MDQPWQRLPLKIPKLFEWLVGQYLTLCAAKVLLLMGMHAVQRYARVRPNARPFAIEGQPSIFGDGIHGFAEHSDGFIVRIAIVACQAVSQWRGGFFDIGESIVWKYWLVRPRGVVDGISMVNRVVQATAANLASMLACGTHKRG